MNNRHLTALLSGFAALMCVSTPSSAKDLWVTAYFPGWQSTLKASDVDFRIVTHLDYFALVVKADGTLDASANGLTDAGAAAVVSAAHAAHRKALVTVGGENSGPTFEAAIAPAVRPAFIKNIVDWAMSRHFDGVDIDMEPTLSADAPNYQAFLHELRLALRAKDPHAMVTAAVGDTPSIYAPILADVDQVNLMTYDMSGPWEGWETWYNSCLYNGGRRFKSVDKPLPSTDRMVDDMTGGGVMSTKLGIGICMYGVAWHGAAGPNEPIDGVTTEGISYADIMTKYYSPDRYHWDGGPDAAYLAVDAPNRADRVFVAYDDAKACAEKVAYARKAHLGGLIIWELAGGYRPDQPAGKRDDLLQSIGAAINSGR